MKANQQPDEIVETLEALAHLDGAGLLPTNWTSPDERAASIERHPSSFRRREYSVCAHCDEEILRLPGGMWEHLWNPRDEWDHVPEPELAPLTEEEAQLSFFEAVCGEPDVMSFVGDVEVVKMKGEVL